MQAIPRVLVDGFAAEYAGKNRGFSAVEITDYFAKYSNLVRPLDHYGFTPVRLNLFIESVYALTPKQQYYALNDLTLKQYPSRYSYPTQAIREGLRNKLHSFISPDPIGLCFSSIHEPEFREDWLICNTRLLSNPAASITSARTMLETLLRTIITERNGSPDSSGELNKLLKQTEDILDFSRSDRKAEHQILTGLASAVHGIATISNDAGDRHGLVVGQAIDDPSIAQLCINASGAIGLFMLDMHLLTRSNLGIWRPNTCSSAGLGLNSAK
jgi:hypothetical protein